MHNGPRDVGRTVPVAEPQAGPYRPARPALLVGWQGHAEDGAFARRAVDFDAAAVVGDDPPAF